MDLGVAIECENRVSVDRGNRLVIERGNRFSIVIDAGNRLAVAIADGRRGHRFALEIIIDYWNPLIRSN